MTEWYIKNISKLIMTQHQIYFVAHPWKRPQTLACLVRTDILKVSPPPSSLTLRPEPSLLHSNPVSKLTKEC